MLGIIDKKFICLALNKVELSVFFMENFLPSHQSKSLHDDFDKNEINETFDPSLDKWHN